ncbi:MAG TPA: hypothetical protein PKC59_12685, partial [Burkholderiaceae bacterium]|nr:hypothetical protein [Burkholderiaceae bacterium]
MFEFKPVERPYPGLRPFEAHEAEIFFGRERHTDRLLTILQRERFLAVIGPSGSGKSSLVRAGLLPGLAMGSLGTGSDWRIALLRPGDRPMRSLAAALLQPDVLGRHLLATPEAEAGEADIAALEAELRRGPLSLSRLVAEAQRRHRESAEPGDSAAGTPTAPPAFNLLVLVDQFEEIFTYAEAGGRPAADESDAFVSLLLAAAEDARQHRDQPGTHVALTMRTDFLGNCVRFADLPETINQAQYLTPRLKRDEIERAIRGPAELWGGRIDDRLVAELINATGQSADQLPLVQHALARMWAEAVRRNPDAPVIDWAVADAVGGAARAIEVHAQEIWAGLNEEERFLVRGLFTAITERRGAESGGQAVRRPQTLERIADWLDRPANKLVPLIQRYAAPDVCFLQYRPPLDGASVIDISHEAVIRQWAELAGWVDDEADRGQFVVELHRRALQYRAGQISLLTGADLARALDWVYWGVLPKGNEVAEVDDRWAHPAWGQRYLGQPRFTEQEKKDLFEEIWETTDPRVIASARLSVTEGFVSESHRAAGQAQRAETERIERERDYQRQLAEAAQTQAQRAKRQTIIFAVFGILALALALLSGWAWQRATDSATEANRQKEMAERATVLADSATAEAKQKALQAEASASEAETQRLKAEESARNETAAALAADMARRKAETSEQLAKAALLDATQRRLVSDAGAIYSGRKVGGDVNGMRLALAALRLKPTPEAFSELQLPAAEHGESRIFEARDHVNAVAWSPDGQRIVSGSWDNTLRLWDARTGEPIGQPLKGHGSSVASVAWSPDGQRIVSGSGDNTLRLWEARTGEPIGQPLKGHGSSVASVAWSPDGQRIVSGSGDNTLRLWDARTGEPIGQPLK